jgi:hypothetical protein
MNDTNFHCLMRVEQEVETLLGMQDSWSYTDFLNKLYSRLD